MRYIVLAAALFSVLPVAVQAQSSRCDRMPTEEEYQRCIEREGSNQSFDPRDIGAGSTQSKPPPDFEAQPQEPAEPMDTLPPASRRHVQQEMAKKVYAKVGDWTPEARDQEYDFEPSEAAQQDPQLRKQEEEAFAAELEAYHDREQQVAGGGTGGGQDGESEEPGGGSVVVRGDVNERGSPSPGGGASSGQSRSVIDILGDLTATGNGTTPSGQSGDQQAPGPSSEPVQVAGDVTIDRDAGQVAGADGQGGGSGGSAEEEEAGDGADAGDGQGTAQDPSGSAGGGGDEALASTSDSAGTNDVDPSPETMPGQPGEDQQTAQAGGGTPESTDSGDPGQQSEPSVPSLPGSEASSPPPSPPRPIPSAEAIAAEMLAKLFGGAGEEEEAQEFSDAPFVDWSNPDPEQQTSAQAANDAIEDAAQTALSEPLETQSSPAPDTDALARQIDKEEARLAALEAQAADAARIAETQNRIEDLRETEPLATASAADAPISAQAARRIAVMGLP